MADDTQQQPQQQALPAYTLSLTLLSDGEPVRSLCHVPVPPSSPSSSAANAPPNASSSSSSSDQPNDPSSYQLITGSQSGILTSHTLATSAAAAFSSQPVTALQPGGDGTRHPHQITALLPIPAEFDSLSSLAGGYVTGCKDSIIRVFGPDHQLKNELTGHGNAVTSLSWLYFSPPSSSGAGTGASVVPPPPPLLISGSWDGTAKLWNLATGMCVATMGEHENTVSVVGLPPPPPPDGGGGEGETAAFTGRLATTSAGIAEGNSIRNHRVRIFAVTLPLPTATPATSASAKCTLVQTVSNDHQGPIRSVTYDSQTDCIVTASNDGTVKLRDGSTGECHTTLAHPGTGGGQGGPPMLLSVACLGAGRYVATSEDGTAIVWDVSSGGGGEPQVLDHPGCVWTVLPLPTGGGEGPDFATACQDGFVRIFTLDPTRAAPPTEIAALADAVSASRAKTSTGPTPDEIANLPKWEMAALTQGRSEGQVQVFNRDDKAIAAQWSATSATWIEVGEVTGTNQNAGEIDGVRYDHVLPIEVDTVGGGVRKLRIGYDNGQNPFVVAQKFIDDYELDQNYLSQIADYIQQRVGEQGPTLGSGGGGGGGAGAAAAPPPSSSAGTVPMDVTPHYDHLPMKGYKSFESGTDPKTLSKIIAKIREFNSSLTTNLTDSESNRTLDELCDTLSATSRYHATTVSDSELAVLGKMLRNWDANRSFPALDLARLAVVHPDASRSDRFGFWAEVVKLALDKCRIVREDNVEGTAAVAVPMLTMRLCANCFRGGRGSSGAVAGQLRSVLDCAESFASSPNKNVRLAVATVVLNASSYMMSSGAGGAAGGASSGGGHDSSPEQVLTVVGTIIGSGLYETEATVRSLVALGTALLADAAAPGGAGGGAAREKAKSLHVESMVQHAGSQHGDKAKAVAEEIRLILQG